MKRITDAILEAMKGEGWMMARDIAEILQTQGYKASGIKVAHIIRSRLTHRVETRPVRAAPHWNLYRLKRPSSYHVEREREGRYPP